jgi:hypothetical protein
MSVRREREHVSLPLNAVAMSFAVSVSAEPIELPRRGPIHPPILFLLCSRELFGEIDVPARYQKAGRIDFTTRCLAFVFGESGACSKVFAFGQQSLRMTRARRKCWWSLTAPVAIDANAPHKFEVRAVLRMRMMWFSVGIIR